MNAMESTPNVVIPQPDGPNIVTGDLAVVTPTGVRLMQTAMLCRCGRSSDKPFCDGTHVKVGFCDAARLAADVPSETVGFGRVTITPRANGPNRCEGPLTVRDATGRAATAQSTVLCRCGASANKPYCDGSHKRIGFAG